MSDTGSWFPVPDEAELPGGLRGLFAKAREKLGFVPNVFRVWAFRPERLSAWFTHFRSLHEPSENLSAADRELVAVVVEPGQRLPVLPRRPRRRAARGAWRPRARRADRVRLAPRGPRRPPDGDLRLRGEAHADAARA